MFNKGGKTLTIFVLLIIVLLVCSTSIGFYLYHLEEGLHKAAENDLNSSRADAAKLQSQLKDVQSQLALVEDKKREDDQKINNLLDEQDLNEGLRNALKKENAKLKDQLDDIEKSKQKIKADLDDSVSKLSQFQDLLKVSQEKNKELETRLADLAQTNKNMESTIKELKTQMKPVAPPPVEGQAATNTDAIPASGPVGADKKIELDKIVVNPESNTKGHILSVDTDAEFVVFNLGITQGIKPDSVLSVYHGDEYLGDIKATRIQDEMSAADIIPPLSSKEIHKNDTVVLKP